MSFERKPFFVAVTIATSLFLSVSCQALVTIGNHLYIIVVTILLVTCSCLFHVKQWCLLVIIFTS